MTYGAAAEGAGADAADSGLEPFFFFFLPLARKLFSADMVPRCFSRQPPHA